MSRALCALIYSPFFIINIILLLDILTKDKSNRLIRHTIFVYVSIVGWQACEMIRFLSKDTRLIRYVFDIKLIFIGFLAVAIFQMFVVFYRLDRFISRRSRQLLFVIPTITAILSITTNSHNLLIKEFVFSTIDTYDIIHMLRGPWFNVHATYSQFMIVLLAYIIFSKSNKLPKGYQSGSTFMVMAIVTYLMGTAIESFNLDNSSVIDFNLLSGSLSSYFFYIATILNGRTDYLLIERKEIFNFLDESIIIINHEGMIVDINVAAHNFAAQIGKDIMYIPFDKLFYGCTVSLRPNADEEGEDAYILGSGFPIIYNINKQPLFNNKGNHYGEYAALTDVTKNRLFIERLRELAGVDSLTGLANRYRYQEILRTLDNEENLPFSVIIGDANGLKKINDNNGHEMGDLLLKTMATALITSCPENGVAARIGGDEFALLLPKHTADEASEVMRLIKKHLNGITDIQPPPSMALGSATKTRVTENLSALINNADSNMYIDKG